MGLRARAVEDMELSVLAAGGGGRTMRILMTGHLGYIGTAAVPM